MNFTELKTIVGEKIMIDKMFINALIVTMNPNKDVLENGAIAVHDGKIIAIDKTENVLASFSSDNIFDFSGKLIIPGLINTHTHIPMSYLRGYADDLPLETWLKKYIWPTENHFNKPEYIYDASIHGIAELIFNGITCFNDMYFIENKTAEAAKKLGIRAILGEGIIDFDDEGKNTEKVLNKIEKLIENYQDDKIKFSVSPHSIYTCTKNSLIKASEFSKKNNLLYHIHLSETKKEVADSIKNFGKPPVEYLNDLNILSPNTIAAHCIHLSDKEIEILAQKEVSVSLNTKSNFKLGSGVVPIKRMLQKNIRLTFGTDSVASNNNLSIIEEMSFTCKIKKGLYHDPTILPAFNVLKMATIEAAKALHINDKVGSLEPGKCADFISFDLDNFINSPMYNPYSLIIYSINSSFIKDVIISGEFVLKNRKLSFYDENEILEKAKFYQSKIMEFKKTL